MIKLKKSNLQDLLKKWAAHFKVLAPSIENDEIMMMPYDENTFTMDYLNSPVSIKEFFYEQREVLFKWEQNENQLKTFDPDYSKLDNKLLFGVRACDAYGIAYMDRFFTKEFVDNNYVQRRAKTFVVAVNCTEPGENCFCSSMGAGPFAEKGYDIALTPLKDEYIVEVGTEKGEKLISLGKEFLTEVNSSISEDKKGLLKDVEGKFVKDFNISNMLELLDENFDNPIWEQLAKGCINCTGCTTVCPTCTCFNVVEENDKCSGSCDSCSTHSSGTRVRFWDSCQSESFTRNAGEHNPRNNASRIKYRIYDKLKYIEQKFGMKGCTGCGRCIQTCPACIDFVNVINKFADEYVLNEKETSLGECAATDLKDKNHNCTCGENINEFENMIIEKQNIPENIYMPQVAVIKEVIEETWNIKRFVVEYEDKSLHEKFKFHGQFFEITVFGVGEIAISIPFSDSQKTHFDFCIKKAGKVTSAIHEMKAGDKIGLRGPFGEGFPFEKAKGRDVLVIGSGVGVAPVRTLLARALEHKEECGRIVMIASAGSYDGLVYKDDLKEWGKMDGVDVLYALARPTDEVDAHVGYINDLFADLGLDWKNTTAIVCASPRRIKLVAKDLMDLGMNGNDILTSLETHMRCGVGKCGHCKVGEKYMCIDGPVFSYEDMIKLPPEF
ncbi:4Fe-4S dicluster domain-containing protein [Oceanirhabdus seepicola]|uniref:4Fe-4S dicluster domain-containing protein n=1 Tax=Oceanirhabdus seepicola TaxID=2828781 RepID=A0A9J6NY15_9CLOT|nr:4Fe-4S dicluster domain-containing protein [Oceanirhabdus seepicola]MCM1988878.1 4Fe-4S dicluster domain-containing protein [Oceanirhabdus seepicola]